MKRFLTLCLLAGLVGGAFAQTIRLRPDQLDKSPDRVWTLGGVTIGPNGYLRPGLNLTAPSLILEGAPGADYIRTMSLLPGAFRVDGAHRVYGAGLVLPTAQYGALGISVAGGAASLVYDDANGHWTLASSDGLHVGPVETTGVTVTGTGGSGSITYNNGFVFSPALPFAPTVHTHTIGNVSGVVPASQGGAGTVSGVLKANGSGAVSAAAPGTDYLAPNGSGASLTALNATQLTSGSIPAARFAATTVPLSAINATGAPDGTKYLRGDGTWSTPAGGATPPSTTSLLAGDGAGGFTDTTVAVSNVPKLNGANTFANGQVVASGLNTLILGYNGLVFYNEATVTDQAMVWDPATGFTFEANVTAAAFHGSGAGLTATSIPVGSINATGTPDATTFLRGDGAWAAAGGGLSAGGTLTGSLATQNLYTFTGNAYHATANTYAAIVGGNTDAANNQTGVKGLSYGGYGVYGQTSTNLYHGVYGKHTASGVGVYGESSSGYGVEGYSPSGSGGVYGYSGSAFGPALKGYNGGNYAALVLNQAHASADIARFQKGGADVAVLNNTGVATSGFWLRATRAAHDQAEIGANSVATFTVTVTGAVVGDVASASPNADQGNVTWSARVSAADTVTVTLANPTAVAVDPASCDWKVAVFR